MGDLSLPTSGLLGQSACDTSAVGVESCREIEYARCDAAFDCPTTFKISSPAACRRFYRDHCLHGLDIAVDPGATKVNQCVNAINTLWVCARGSESASLQDCGLSYTGVDGATSVLANSNARKHSSMLVPEPRCEQRLRQLVPRFLPRR